MLAHRRSEDRGFVDLGWLKSRHSFSFGHYHDPRHMGFGSLRVINEDRVVPGAGFDTHGHKDMEIISYVLSGALAHKDSLGTGAVIRPGEVQRMSAGTGIRHSEFNHSETQPVHFLQIWLFPERSGLTPSYEQKDFALEEKRGRLRLVASRDGREGSVTVHQDVDLYATVLAPGERVEHQPRPGRRLWIQVARGSVSANGVRLAPGDGLGVVDESVMTIEALDDEAELLLFDLA